MQSNFEIVAGIQQHQRNQQPQMEHHQQQQQHQQQPRFIVENTSTSTSSSSPFFPINPNFHHHLLQQQQQLQPVNPHFVHQIQHHLPFTQQFLQYQQQPQPHYNNRSILDQHQQQHEEIDEGVFNNLPLNFKLGMEENSRSTKVERQEDALIRGSERYCTEPRQTSLAVSHCWQNQEDSAIKLPFWKPLCQEFSNGNNSNSKESENKLQEVDQEMYNTEEIHQQQHEEIKSKVLFGELEAIYATKANNNAHDDDSSDIHRVVPSESALTAEDLPINNNNVTFPMTTFNGATTIGSESASVGEKEAEVEAEVEAVKEEEVDKRKRRKKGKEEERTSSNSMARFFESLVKKLVNHQENLQKRFMDTIEKMDQERKEREQAWREEELAKVQKNEAARAHERTLALNREAALVSYLEKITGQKINFQEDHNKTSATTTTTNKRWPQVEVDALVQIRNGFESKFQEGGNKGVIWEEISKSMGSMGFQRSARRCKDKWENMHKNSSSVKKTKEITREQLNRSTSTSIDHEKVENKNGSEKKEVKESDKNSSTEEFVSSQPLGSTAAFETTREMNSIEE